MDPVVPMLGAKALTGYWHHNSGQWLSYNPTDMWTKLQNNPRKKAPRKVAVIDPYSCFGAFACSICQAACPVEDCIVEEKDENARWVCAVRIDKCIGCGLCVTVGNPTAPGKRDFGCPADYDAIDMVAYTDVVDAVEEDMGPAKGDAEAEAGPATT